MIRNAILAFVFAASPALADPVEGLWKTQPGDDGSFGHVDMTTCGPQICGTLVAAFDSDGAPTDSDSIGRKLVWAMNASGNGKYRGGKIWAPDQDKTYNSKMVLTGNSLSVSGCVLVICRSQVWTRVN